MVLNSTHTLSYLMSLYHTPQITSFRWRPRPGTHYLISLHLDGFSLHKLARILEKARARWPAICALLGDCADDGVVEPALASATVNVEAEEETQQGQQVNHQLHISQ